MVGAPQRRASWRVAAGLVLVGAGLVAVGVRTNRSGDPEPTDLFASHANLPSMSINYTNRYVETLGPVGTLYPWHKEFIAIAEPRRVGYLQLFCDEGPCDDSQVIWTVDNKQLAETSQRIAYTFEKIGEYHVSATIHSVDDVQHPPKTWFLKSSGKVLVRFVRREIRELFDEDRERLFDAMAVMWSVSTAEGQVHFGERYLAISDLTKMHAKLAGAKDCDHMHDGLGFMTMHLSLGMQFEQSLQSIDGSLSLPYWDFTIDAHMVDTGRWSHFQESQVWQKDWYGQLNETYNTVTEGRWAFVKIETDVWDSTHNSYGYLRSPWNNNNRAFLTRSHTMCGHEFDAMPSCQSHYSLVMHYHTWYKFAWQMPYMPHGNTHVWIGGTVDCSDTYTGIENFLKEKIDFSHHEVLSMFMDDMKDQVFGTLKNMYRGDQLKMPSYCSMDTPFTECHGTCHFEHMDISDIWSTMFPWANNNDYEWLNDAIKKYIVDAACDGGIGADGDQLESASPADPSFWNIHPTIERLWQYKKLSQTFVDEYWPFKDVSLWNTCHGHFPKDAVPFKFALAHNDTQKIYSNAELYELADPLGTTLPFVFHHFEWPHCAEMGYDFRDLLSSRR